MNLTLESATIAQRAAIESDAAEVLAVAGPGSGKTATLVARIRRLILDGVEPQRIAILTFTNAGANELRGRLVDAERVDRDLDSGAEDPEPVELGFAGTLHSFALRMLREHGGPIGYGARLSLISVESARDLLAQRARSLGGKRPPALSRLLELKAAGRHRPAPAGFDLAETIVRTFWAEMRGSGLLDYDMLLDEFFTVLTESSPAALAAVEALRERFTHLFVDEVQDSARIDWWIYRALPARAKFLVGDPDQAIYGFRGGRVDEMVGHSLTPGVVTLTLAANFRSRPEICAAAQRLIEHNAGRIAKETISTRDPGGVVRLLPAAATDGEEIAIVAREIRRQIEAGTPSGSIAVLARTNAIADGFRKALPGAGVPVVVTTRSSLPADFALARAFVELSVDPDNDALASFYLIARAELAGNIPPDVARAQVHAQRLKANAAGKTLNAVALSFTPITRPEIAVEALAGFACRETRAIAGEKLRELPPGAGVLDLALALAAVREYAAEEPGEGVRVLTMHGSKGREFDAVFVVGFEDEAIPGRAEGAELEEERRLAYVAATRARDFLAFSFATSRSSKWEAGARRTPSRFLAEIGLSAEWEQHGNNP